MRKHVSMQILHNQLIKRWTFQDPYACIAQLTKKTNENLGRLMWVLWGENTIKCNMKYQYASIAYSNQNLVYY